MVVGCWRRRNYDILKEMQKQAKLIQISFLLRIKHVFPFPAIQPHKKGIEQNYILHSEVKVCPSVLQKKDFWKLLEEQTWVLILTGSIWCMI